MNASSASTRPAIVWGAVFGAVQAATPLVFWWLDGGVGFALGLALIATVYVGFAVSDGRAQVVAVEAGVALFCATVDVVVAVAIAVEIAAGLDFG